ncbi:hypothetical protein AMTR_s00047p00206730 [Amborella trichopoda]|uniref:Uncharacterized protein n=1 Tax=Amborella trichopoda TaxID=13333 RepID=U5D6I1_AMBTC|nr:hypothetical protein AMTR_s00047p00206730 [Amborella trichopoda]
MHRSNAEEDARMKDRGNTNIFFRIMEGTARKPGLGAVPSISIEVSERNHQLKNKILANETKLSLGNNFMQNASL